MSNLEASADTTQLVFPSRLLWLGGAPGAGKGTHTHFILNILGLRQPPIVISDLLKTPEAKKMMDAGVLVGDDEVSLLLVKKLLEPAYQEGAIIDGYPRTLPQSEFVSDLFACMQALHQQAPATYAKPNFQVLILMVDESTSIHRQLERGKKALAAPLSQAVRATDLDPQKALKRYHVFCEATYTALQALQKQFPYAVVDAQGDILSVQQAIEQALWRPV